MTAPEREVLDRDRRRTLTLTGVIVSVIAIVVPAGISIIAIVVATDAVTRWWWERFGEGAVYWDELALLTDGEEIGPVELPVPEVGFTGWGLPLAGVS